MAKQASELLNRKVLQNFRTKKTNEEIISLPLQNNVALGEIIVQMGTGENADEQAKKTGLWTLASDGVTPVRFPSEERVEEMIQGGAVAEVDNIEDAVGLSSGGTYIEKSGTAYLDSATTVEEEIAALDTALSGVQEQINEMDKAADAVNGQVVTTVSETDGKVSETKANVKDLQLGGYAKSDETGSIAGTDTINTALSKLENTIGANKVSNADGSINVVTATTGTDINVNIKSGETVIRKDNDEGLYTDIKISSATTEELATLGTNVREAYKLLDSYGGQLGDWIKIYKDSSLVNVELGHIGDLLEGTSATTEESDSPTIVPTTDTGASEALNFVHQLENSKYKLTQVDVESFLQEAEFKDGLSVVNHEVKVKIDNNSEKDSQETPVSFLTVGPDGVKLDGIKAEITRKIEALDYTDSAATGEYVTEVNEANGVISVDRANVSEAPLNNYVKGEDATAVVATDTINQAVSKLEKQTDTLARATESELSSIKDDLEAFKKKLTLSGKENNYAKVTVTTADTGTTIEVSAKTHDIKTSSATTDGLADSYDVKTFAINGIHTDSTGEGVVAYDKSAGVVVSEDTSDESVRKLDFSHLVVDCGEF